jgi:hypothetical protein
MAGFPHSTRVWRRATSRTPWPYFEKLVPAYQPSDALFGAAGFSPGSRLALPATRVA